MKTLTNFFENIFDINDPSTVLNNEFEGKVLDSESSNLKIKDIKKMEMTITEIKNGHSYISDSTWDDIIKYHNLGIKEFRFKTWKTSVMSDLKDVDWGDIHMSFNRLNLLYFNTYDVYNMNLDVEYFLYNSHGLKFHKSKINCKRMEIERIPVKPFFDNSCKINVDYLSLDYSTGDLRHRNSADVIKQLIKDIHNGKKFKKFPSELLGLGKMNIKDILIKVESLEGDNYYSISSNTRNQTCNWYEMGNGWYFGESKKNKFTLD